MKGKARESTKRNHVQVAMSAYRPYLKRQSIHRASPIAQVSSSKKEKREFEDLGLAQTLSRHSGTIWTMKFSHDGARLVSGGQDAILRVWRVRLSSGDDDRSTQESGEKQILESEPEQSYQVCALASSS